MIFLGNLTPITSTKSQVGFVHNMPFDTDNGMGMTQAQLEAIGILVETIPTEQPPAGQIVSGLFIDPTTKNVTYEYATPPKKQEQQMADMQSALIEAQNAINVLLGV